MAHELSQASIQAIPNLNDKSQKPKFIFLTKSFQSVNSIKTAEYFRHNLGQITEISFATSSKILQIRSVLRNCQRRSCARTHVPSRAAAYLVGYQSQSVRIIASSTRLSRLYPLLDQY